MNDEWVTLAPAMVGAAAPVWDGARWIGTVDLAEVPQGKDLRLEKSEGYRRARLLVRDGAAVRGFVDLEAPHGMITRGALEAAAATLPTAQRVPRRGHVSPITVVVCTRDRPSSLRTCLQAILEVDYPDFDVLVVDNAARTTETAALVAREFADPRLRLVVDPTPGLAHARNTGLCHARAGIVAFTDDDVVVDPAWLSELAAAFQQVPRPACVTGLVPAGEVSSPAQAYFDARVAWSRTVTPAVYTMSHPPKGLPKFPFSPGAFGTGANFAVNRSVALALGGFDTALGAGTRTGGGEDIDMFTRVLLAGYPLVVQPSAIAWHRHRGGIQELESQARSYGTGLGAWLTKVCLDPRTAALATGRIPRVVWGAIRARRERRAARGGVPWAGSGWETDLARVHRAELHGVAFGPLTYLKERRARIGEWHGTAVP